MKFGHYGIIPICKAFDEEILNILLKSGMKVHEKIINLPPFISHPVFDKHSCYLCESEKYFRSIEWEESYPFYEVYFHESKRGTVLSHVKESIEDDGLREVGLNKFYKCGSCKNIHYTCSSRRKRDLLSGYGYGCCEYYEKSFISRFKIINKIRVWMATHNIFGEML